MKYLEFHKDCLKTGRLPERGLCRSLRGKKLRLRLFQPTLEERLEMSSEGLSTVYWGSGLPIGHLNKFYEYTPLRQNIVLFLAAMNRESFKFR